MFMLGSALFINNTAILLRIYATLGSIFVLVSLCLGSYLLYVDLTQHHPIYSRKFLFLSILFFSGVIMIGISIVGEYIARIMQNVERKPLYSIRKIYKKK